ncbi:MAG TPA: hypothetical protein VF170_00485, partial [Planctomycetaceae bacterium]
EFRYIPVVACVLLVTLRLFIGWQFLYEGLWKVDTLDTAQPWTAAGFLKNAQGPFREFFREELADDPDELGWLDEKTVAARWDDWAKRFTGHYGLTEKQQAQLLAMLNGPEDYRAPLSALPKGVRIPRDLGEVIRFDAKAKRLIVDADNPLTPSDVQKLLSLAQEPTGTTDADRAEAARVREYREAVVRLGELSRRPPSFKRRLRVALGPSDPDRVRHLFSNFKGTLGDPDPNQKIDEYYQHLLAGYQARLEQAEATDLAFQREHLEREWREIQELRTELTGPIKALDSELKAAARELLTPAQVARGAVSEPWTTQRVVDTLTITALIGLGLMLIAGFGTRAAAVMGAGMVLSFYLVWPPWPGVPVDPGPEHAFIVNKNLIEVVALLALAALPTGQWFGVDRLIYRGWRWLRVRRSVRPAAAPPVTEKSTVAATAR